MTLITVAGFLYWYFMRRLGWGCEARELKCLNLRTLLMEPVPSGDCVLGRDAQPALVIGRHYITERDSAPVQYNGVV